jgi:hypothetical protein
MISDPLTLDDASAVATTFNKKGSSLTSSVWTEPDRTPDQPRTIQISHEVSGKKGNEVARRLVKFSSTDKDTDGVYHTCSAHVVMTHGMASDPEAVVQDLIAFMKDFLSTATISDILDGLT